MTSKNIDYVLSYKRRLDYMNISFVHIGEDNYPTLLKHIFNPPIVLYYKGTLPKKKNVNVYILQSETDLII